MANVKMGSMFRINLGRFAEPYRNLMGYRKYGLLLDDLHMEETIGVSEAISRLTDKQRYDRIFRMNTALSLNASHAILPVELWTKSSEDVPYLTPLIEQAQKEIYEKQFYDNN